MEIRELIWTFFFTIKISEELPVILTTLKQSNKLSFWPCKVRFSGFQSLLLSGFSSRSQFLGEDVLQLCDDTQGARHMGKTDLPGSMAFLDGS